MTNTQPEAEEMPGYDGPTLDAADRLHMWMDKSVPAADRDRLIAEHRDEVLGEAAEIARANCHLKPGQCGCHTAADHILAARDETYDQKFERLRMAGAHELSRRHAERNARTTQEG